MKRSLGILALVLMIASLAILSAEEPDFNCYVGKVTKVVDKIPDEVAEMAFSPDGQKICYKTSRLKGTAVYLIDIETRKVTELSDMPFPYERNLVTEKEKRTVNIANPPTGIDRVRHPLNENMILDSVFERQHYHLVLRNKQTGKEALLVSKAVFGYWSSDGKSIVFLTEGVDIKHGERLRTGADNIYLLKLPDNWEDKLQWTTNWTKTESIQFQKTEAKVGELVKLTDDEKSFGGVRMTVYRPTLSPDDKKVAFLGVDYYTRIEQVYVVDRDGKNLQKSNEKELPWEALYVTNEEKKELGWQAREEARSYVCTWSPDKKFVLHGRFSGAFYYLTVYDITTKKYALLGEKITGGSWAPDGKSIAFCPEGVEILPRGRTLTKKGDIIYLLDLGDDWTAKVKWMDLTDIERTIHTPPKK